MLRDISWREFLEWQDFVELEPLDRDTYQLALIAQILVNQNRDVTKYPQGFPLKDFLLVFDESEKTAQPKQTVEYMERVLLDWTFVHNAILREKRGGDPDRWRDGRVTRHRPTSWALHTRASRRRSTRPPPPLGRPHE